MITKTKDSDINLIILEGNPINSREPPIKIKIMKTPSKKTLWDFCCLTNQIITGIIAMTHSAINLFNTIYQFKTIQKFSNNGRNCKLII